MTELVCIVCPNSCKLTIADNGDVTGNKCPRGKKFADEELTCPKRTICTTVATTFADYPVLPVRTESEIPKDKINDLMALINNFTLDKRVARGDVVIENVLGTGVNIIATSNMKYDYFKK